MLRNPARRAAARALTGPVAFLVAGLLDLALYFVQSAGRALRAASASSTIRPR